MNFQRLWIPTLALITVNNVMLAQQSADSSSKSKSRFAPTDILISLGAGVQGVKPHSFNVFRDIAPNDPIVNTPIGYEYMLDYARVVTPIAMLNVSLGYDLKNLTGRNYWGRPTIRLGLQGGRSNVYSSSLSNYSYKSFDSFTANNGSKMVIDSFYRNTINGSYISSYALLDASIIWRTGDKSKWSIYGGVGLGVGATFMNKSHYHLMSSSGVMLNENGRNPFMNIYSNYTQLKSSEVSHKPGLMMQAYIPYGISYRLSNTHNLLKKVSVFYEGRLGINYYTIPESTGVSRPAWTHSIGLRIKL